jgi:hypothetical protein
MNNAPITRETADHAELAANVHIRNLRLAAGRDFAVSGYSDGLIVEQDMRGMLLAAAEAFDALLSEIAALKGEVDHNWPEVERVDLETRLSEQANRATQAERQRDELRKALEDHDQTAAECRIDGARPQRDTTAPCDLCGATQRESCGRKGSAAYAFISTARTLFATQGADQCPE